MLVVVLMTLRIGGAPKGDAFKKVDKWTDRQDGALKEIDKLNKFKMQLK